MFFFYDELVMPMYALTVLKSKHKNTKKKARFWKGECQVVTKPFFGAQKMSNSRL